MILRDDKGYVIFAAYRRLFYCNDALESELHVIREDIDLAIHRTPLSVLLQFDRSNALSAIMDISLDKLAYGHLNYEIKLSMEYTVFTHVKIAREHNRISDCLANFGHSGDSTTCWLNQTPTCAMKLVASDCNPMTME